MGLLGLLIATVLAGGFMVNKAFDLKAQRRLAIGELGLKERTLEAGIEGKKLGIIEKKKMTKEAMKDIKGLKRSEQMQEMTMANKALAAGRTQSQTAQIVTMIQALQRGQTSGIVSPPNPNVPVHTYLRR